MKPVLGSGFITSRDRSAPAETAGVSDHAADAIASDVRVCYDQYLDTITRLAAASVGHNGAIYGCSTWVLYDPESTVAIVVLANRCELETADASTNASASLHGSSRVGSRRRWPPHAVPSMTHRRDTGPTTGRPEASLAR